MTTSRRKKHPCPDCHQCQQCSEARCRLCRGQGAEAAERRFAALSMAQQIELFEKVSAGLAPEGDYHHGCGRGSSCRRSGGDHD